MPEETHAAAEDHDDPTAITVWIVGALSCFLLVALLFSLETLHYTATKKERQRKVISQEYEPLRQARAEQTEVLNTYRWVDKKNGVVAIPVERAMQLVVERARQRSGRSPGR